jgi:predicted DNA-binding ribbon-helix-helix protein
MRQEMKEHKGTNRPDRGSREKAGATSTVNFELNPFYERLLEMKEERPAAFNNLSAATRLAVRAYIKAKQTSSETKARKTAA